MNGNAKATNGVTAFASVENNFSSIEQVTGVRAFAFYLAAIMKSAYTPQAYSIYGHRTENHSYVTLRFNSLFCSLNTAR